MDQTITQQKHEEKAATGKLERCVVLSMPCIPKVTVRENPTLFRGTIGKPRSCERLKTSAGTVEIPTKYIDRISEHGYVSEFHHGVLHKHIPLQDATNIRDARALDKECDKMRKSTGLVFF